MSIGLKGAWSETKGCSLRHRLSMLKLNLRYAWQRAWRGYDDVDVFSMHGNFIEKYSLILKDFRKSHVCLFNVPMECRDKSDKDYYTDEETNAIIDKMIYHLEMMDETNVQRALCGTDHHSPLTFKDWKHISDTTNEHKKEFMKLFSDFFWELWD